MEEFTIDGESKPASNELKSTQHLPLELIFELLLGLPVKSLLRFKCVSRSWLSLISSPEFNRAHLKFNKRVLMLAMDPQFRYYGKHCSLSSLLHEKQEALDVLNLNWPYREKFIDYVSCIGACNGLICMAVYRTTLFLWNPSTGKFRNLPEFCITWEDDEFHLVSGFGYDEVNDDFVAVSFIWDLNDIGEPIRSWAYKHSLKTKYWKRIPYPGGCFPCWDECGVFMNGKVHFSTSRKFLFSVDLARETYKILELPDGMVSPTKLGMFEDKLCLLACKHDLASDLWVMKEYDVRESWTKVFTIPSRLSFNFIKNAPLCISSAGGEFLLVFKNELGIYNAQDNSFRPLMKSVDKTLHATFFVESMVLPEFTSDTVRSESWAVVGSRKGFLDIIRDLIVKLLPCLTVKDS